MSHLGSLTGASSVRVTRKAEKKLKAEKFGAVAEPQPSTEIFTSRWTCSIISDGDILKLKAEGLFPSNLKYQIPLSIEEFPAPVRMSSISTFFCEASVSLCIPSCEGSSFSLAFSSTSSTHQHSSHRELHYVL